MTRNDKPGSKMLVGLFCGCCVDTMSLHILLVLFAACSFVRRGRGVKYLLKTCCGLSIATETIHGSLLCVHRYLQESIIPGEVLSMQDAGAQERRDAGAQERREVHCIA